MKKNLLHGLCGILLCIPFFVSAQETETIIPTPAEAAESIEQTIPPSMEIEVLENGVEVSNKNPIPTLYSEKTEGIKMDSDNLIQEVDNNFSPEKEAFVDKFTAIFSIIIIFVTYVFLPIGAIVLIIIGARKNWNTKRKKEKSVGFAGFWKRVAIKSFDKMLGILIVPILFNVYYYLRDGQTIGDKIFGGKIIDKKSHEIASVGKLLIRFLAKLPSILALGVGFWPAGWRKEKNTWHDSLSDTRYISTKKIAGGWIILTIILSIALPLMLIVPTILATLTEFNTL